MTQVWMQILVMAAVTFAATDNVTSPTIPRERAFRNAVAGLIAFAVGIVFAFRGAGLSATSVCCCAAVFLAQLL